VCSSDLESDAVAAERVDDPADLVPTRDHPGVDVRGRADLEDDATLLEHRHGPRVVGGLDAVPDAIRLEELDDAGDLFGRARLAGMDRQAEAELPRSTEQVAVIGDTEGRGLRAGDVDPDDAAIAP